MRSLLLTIILMIATVAKAAPFTVVIDAGHGGRDSGAPGTTLKEKEVNLNVALRLGKALKKTLKDDVKVIYTRDTDHFVKLAERAEMANRADADIFVSIHCNSIADTKRRNQVQGASVYVRGFASSTQASEVAELENSVLELEDKGRPAMSAEESILSDLKWNKNLEESIALASTLLDELVSTAGRRRGAVEQNDLAVLKRTKMPAVLVELEYICNNDMERFMASADGQDKFAEALCNGITTYLRGGAKKPAVRTEGRPAVRTESRPAKEKKAERNTEKNTEKNAEKKTDRKAAAKAETGVRYKVQFMTSSKVIAPDSPRFKGLKGVDHYRDGVTVKYTVGSFATMKEATAYLPIIRELFPDAFIIKTENGVRIK